jgi:proteic killer suppression protein
MINAAININDLRIPPGNRLEALKDDLVGFFSIRINDQYRVVFSFNQSNAFNVQIVDYH